MDLIIAHSDGWACTNDSAEDYRIKLEDGISKKIPLIVANKVFDAIGKLEKGSEAMFIRKEGKSYNCLILAVTRENVTAEIKSTLTENQIKTIITKIKNHGRSTR